MSLCFRKASRESRKKILLTLYRKVVVAITVSAARRQSTKQIKRIRIGRAGQSCATPLGTGTDF